ncbi:glycosyl hydrolases family 38 protein [Stylonychia lemnae]|uniref:Glycosyl hydrolases family 38 protein n=1 Tax=Stylonychia lemnae TaxID=5949 RepID=A0A077ZP14_STYLE|nr:glycosyl hydrolases family 38 protein [Stylonychia lemnae]|eukprot:CDW71653.1 glycosyl hydrolases family 38 protein [Stylonychia lemnae]
MNRYQLLQLSLVISGLIQVSAFKTNFDFHGNNNHKNNDKKEDQKVNEEPIQVHLIGHTHNDLGWLKTVDQSFTGTNEKQARGSIQMILDTTIHHLIKDPSKRFCYCEIKYFSMWWKYQNDEMKQKVKDIVKQGRLEFVNGGWVSHDEATTNYEDQINNMYIGHQFLKKELDYSPKVAWQVDVFGHSTSAQRLFPDMGLNAVYFERIDGQDLQNRIQNKNFEMQWRPMFNHVGKQSQIFSHVLKDGYCNENYFGFDSRDDSDNDTAFIDNPDYDTFNADWKSQEFMKIVQSFVQAQRHNHVMISFGCDFYFQNAWQTFKSMDKMIKYINAKYSNVSLFYSTPGYYSEKISQLDITWPTNYDDFFPYRQPSSLDDVWSGYYSTRPTHKKIVRDASTLLQAANRVYALKVIDQSASEQEIQVTMQAQYNLLDQLGIQQHHDAITGTSSLIVADDYMRRIVKSMNDNNIVYQKIISDLAFKSFGIDSNTWDQCTLNNQTYIECPVSAYQDQSFLVVAQNPANIEVQYQKIKLPSDKYDAQVWNTTTKQFDPVRSEIFCHEFTYKDSNQTVNNCEMIVENPISIDSLSLIKINFQNTKKSLEQKKQQNKLNKISYLGEDENGSLFQVTDLKGINRQFYFQLRYYQVESSSQTHSSSDVYKFQPKLDHQISIQYNTFTDQVTSNGEFCQEIFIRYLNKTSGDRYAEVKVRAYEKLPTIEFEVYMDEIPSDQGAQEITVNFKEKETNSKKKQLDNGQVFYTDSNGLEMQRRELNKKPNFQYKTNAVKAFNFFPVTSSIAIVDNQKKMQMTIMNDRAQGGSYDDKSKSIELLFNRRIYEFSGEVINSPLRGTFWVHLFDRTQEQSYQRQQQIQTEQAIQYFYTSQWKENLNVMSHAKINKEGRFAKFVNEDKRNITIKINLIPQEKNKILVRFYNLEDIFDYQSNSDLDKTLVYIDVQDYAKQLFREANSKLNDPNVQIIEKGLTGVQDMSDIIKNKNNLKGDDDSKITPPPTFEDPSKYKIALVAQQIRTFELTYTLKYNKIRDEIIQ